MRGVVLEFEGRGPRYKLNINAIVSSVFHVSAMRVWPRPLWVMVRERGRVVKLGSLRVLVARGWCWKWERVEGGIEGAGGEGIVGLRDV